jgi:hypothetical protein
MEITQILLLITEIIGGATIVFQGLYRLSKLTKSERDDNFFKKVLNALTTISGVFALDNKVISSEDKLNIKILG